MSKKILWMSKNKIHPKQLEALRARFGENVSIFTDTGPFDNAKTIVERFVNDNYDFMVIVAPLSVIEALCREKTQSGKMIPMLWSVSEKEDDPQKIDYFGARGQGFRFVRFRHIKDVKIKFWD